MLTPSELNSGETLLSSRIRQGASSAITFATMGGSARYLEQLTPREGSSILLNKPARSIFMSESQADNTTWFQSQVKLAEVLRSISMKKTAGPIELEQEILSAIFSPYSTASMQITSARQVMTKVGYPKEQLALAELQSPIYSVEHPEKLIKINDGAIAILVLN